MSGDGVLLRKAALAAGRDAIAATQRFADEVMSARDPDSPSFEADTELAEDLLELFPLLMETERSAEASEARRAAACNRSMGPEGRSIGVPWRPRSPEEAPHTRVGE